MLVFLFIISSLTFLNMLYALSDVIGSITCRSFDVAIKDFLRSIPLVFTFFMTLWSLLLFHATFRKHDEQRWKKSVFKNGICLVAFAITNILYILIGLMVGKYSSIVEGSPSPLFPLDSLLYSLIFIVLGVFAILYVKKLENKLPYEVPSRGEIVKKGRGIYCVGMAYWMLVSLFGFIVGILTIFIYDFAHEFVFYGIATILIYLLSPILLAFWEMYFNNLKEEKKKELLLPLAIISMSASIVFIFLYLILLSVGLDAPSNAGFGMFPVAFAASVNVVTLLVVFHPFFVSIVMLIKSLVARKK